MWYHKTAIGKLEHAFTYIESGLAELVFDYPRWDIIQKQRRMIARRVDSLDRRILQLADGLARNRAGHYRWVWVNPSYR